MTLINPPTQVSLLATDRANTVTRRSTAQGSKPLAYAPFGHRSPEPGDAGAGFNGHHLESLGAYLLGNGYRAYRPALGRFDAPDSYSPFWGGGLNSYTYCRGEPVNRRDPSGHADDNTWSYTMIGLGVFAFGGGLGLAMLKPKLMGLGLGLTGGGLIGASTAALGLGPINKDMTLGLNVAALTLLIGGGVGGAAIGRGSATKAGRRSKLPGSFLINEPTANPIYASSGRTASRANSIVTPGSASISPRVSIGSNGSGNPVTQQQLAALLDVSGLNPAVVQRPLSPSGPLSSVLSVAPIPPVQTLGAIRAVSRKSTHQGTGISATENLTRFQIMMAQIRASGGKPSNVPK